jgi:hypothetical protein
MIPRYFKQFLAVALMLIGAVVAPQSLYAQCVPPPSGMVAWWPLDETSGSTSNDITGVNNYGTWMNGPSPVIIGKVGGALSFSGSNSVDVPDQAELNFGTGDFSIDLWIRTTNASGTRTILDKRIGSVSNPTGYVLFLVNGNLGSQIGDGAHYNNCVSTGFVANGNWHHIAVTVDRNNASGWLHYVDGSAVGTPANPTGYQGSLTNTAPFVMARDLIMPSHTFAGTLDEVELFNRVLDSLEIHSIWAADSLGKCKDTCHATGDANNDGVPLTVGDMAYLAAFINASGPTPPVLYSCDLNGDCVINSLDLQVYQNYFIYGMSVFNPYGGYPVLTCCNPTVGESITVTLSGPGAGIGDTIICGQPATFNVHFHNNTGHNILGSTNGFRLYSPDGATWQVPAYDSAGGLDAYYDDGVHVIGLGVDGVGDDTIAIGGTQSSAGGIPDGYNDIVLRITTQVDTNQVGKTICIDSTFFPPAGSWLWALSGGNYTPSWGGPYCFTTTKCWTDMYGYKYHDYDGSGHMDGGEPGIEGWEIYLFEKPTDVVPWATTKTDPNGRYGFCQESFPSNWQNQFIYFAEEVRYPWNRTEPQTPDGRHCVQLIPMVPNGPYNFGNVILGACCLQDGSCVPNLAKGVCDEMSGGPDNWHPNVSCTPNPCDTCIKVPADLVAWYPFDETGPPTPSTAYDIAGQYNAEYLNSPDFVAGKVHGAFRTNWNPNPVNRGIARTVSDPFEQIQSGDFTIDAWVYPEDLLLGGVWLPELDRIIMSNRDWNNGLVFFVRTDPVTKQGSIGLWMYGDRDHHTLYLTSTTPVVPNEWNHVAVTVSRSDGGGKFYNNGVFVGPAFTPRSEDMHYGPLQIGHCNPQDWLHLPSGCGWTNRYFSGLIDELQIFKRALEPYEIADIFNADKWGKCKDHCSLPYVVRMDDDQLTATAKLTIYNGSGQFHDYTWSVTGMPKSLPTLNTDGMGMSFTSNPLPPVIIPPLGHQVISLTMTRPFPYPTFGLGNFAGFKVLSSRTDPGSPTFTCWSSVYGTGQWKLWDIYSIGDEYMAPSPMYPQDVDSIDFGVVNLADSSGGLFKYEIKVVSGCQCDTSNDEIVVSLNGLPAGTSIIDSVTVPLGDSVVITVNAELLEYKPFSFQNIVLLADWDKDGELEPAAAVTIHPITFQDCNSNGQDDSLDIALGVSTDTNSNRFPDECESYQDTTGISCTYGDANGDGTVDISDAVYLILYIFSGGSAPEPLEAGDANCDGGVDISDVVYLITYIFSGGAAPCAP